MEAATPSVPAYVGQGREKPGKTHTMRTSASGQIAGSRLCTEFTLDKR
jgi:hypothetical protein